jgi:hypothetical protein
MKAKKGLDQYPPVGSKVYVCSSKFLAQFLKDFGKKEDCNDLLKIATLPQDKSLEIEISANALFGRHLAIVGTTGGGKSFTIAKLIEEMLKKEQGVKIVLLDATGEFDGLGSDKKEKVRRRKFGKKTDDDNICLGYKNLTESDLFALFTPSGQVQVPVLRNAIKSLKLAKCLEEKKDISYSFYKDGLIKKSGELKENFFKKNTENLDVVESEKADFEIKKLSAQLVLECIYEDADFGKDPSRFGGEDKKAKENCNSLFMRISSKISNSDFSDVFGLNEKEKNEEVKKEKSDLETCFKSFYDRMSKIWVVFVFGNAATARHSARRFKLNGLFFGAPINQRVRPPSH